MSSSFMVDLKNAAGGGTSTVPKVVTATETGTGVDMQLTEGPVHLIVSVGAVDYSSGDETYVITVQESDASGSGYGSLLGDDGLVVTCTAPVASTRQIVQIKSRTKRYVRTVATIAGTTPSLAFCTEFYARKKVIGGSGTQL